MRGRVRGEGGGGRRGGGGGIGLVRGMVEKKSGAMLVWNAGAGIARW